MGAIANLLAFPRADQRRVLGAAMKRHRLPESLGQALLHEATHFSENSANAALTLAIARRIKPAPIDFEKARGILLVGPRGAGKSAVAGKIAHAATLVGRKVELARADGGLALFRTNSHAPELLTVMEADGFNPLNARAASAFRALGEIEGVETIGVVSALNDAEDVSDLVAAFRFRRVIVTHMDLTRRLGAAMAAAMNGAQLAHVTHGPHAEDGLDILTPGALAGQMLEAEFH
jgi:flagellar biosynthesis protein FlhF